MPAQVEQPVQVGPEANFITVAAEGHTWVSVCAGGGELSRESGGAAVASFSVRPGRYLVRTDGALRSVTAEYIELPPAPPFMTGLPTQSIPDISRVPAVLRLSSDAAQRHPADDVAELAADGQSFVTITVEKTSGEGTGEVYLRTTGGTLLDEAGGSRLRSVKLRGGRARLRLMSSTTPGLVTVFAFGQDPAWRADLPIEFV